MKELVSEDVAQIAGLAMLHFNDVDAEGLRIKLNGILQAFSALDRLVVPSELGHDKRSGLVFAELIAQGEQITRSRPDLESHPSCDQECLVAVFPRREGNLLVVPQVIEREE